MTATPAKTAFPTDPAASPWTHPETGKVYEWNGWGWDLQDEQRAPVQTNEVLLSNPSGPNIAPPELPDASNLTTEEEFNQWTYDAVVALADQTGSSVHVDADPPDPATVEVGDLWFMSTTDLVLYIAINTGTYGIQWVPASPPVSLEGITSYAQDLERMIHETNRQMVPFDNVYAPFAEATENRLVELEEELDSLAPALERGQWQLCFGDEEITEGRYKLGGTVTSQYCQQIYMECLEAIDGGPDSNPSAAAACTRLMGQCDEAVDQGGKVYHGSWEHVTEILFNKQDLEGKEHTFGDCKAGTMIDLFDLGDSGYGLFKVTEEPVKDGDVITIAVEPVQHQGMAGGTARIKIFEMGEVDGTGFIRKGSVSSDGTEERINEYLYGTRLEFKGDSSFIRIKEKAWLGAYENTTMKAKMSPLGLFNMADQPPADDNHHRVWVPNITQMQERFAGTKKGKEVNLYVEHNILYAEWD